MNFYLGSIKKLIGFISLREIGPNHSLKYAFKQPRMKLKNGFLSVDCPINPWSTGITDISGI